MNEKQLLAVKKELDEKLRHVFIKGILEGTRITSENVLKWIGEGKTDEELIKLVKGLQSKELKKVLTKERGNRNDKEKIRRNS